MKKPTMEELQDILPMLPAFVAALAVMLAVWILAKIVRFLIGKSRGLRPGNWTSNHPELDQIFRLAGNSAEFIPDHEAADGHLSRGCYRLRVRGRKRNHVQTLMSALHAPHCGWHYQPGDDDGNPSVLSCRLFRIEV